MAVLRAVLYSRISHDPADRQLGVERQEQDCLRLISARGFELACPPYRENDTSASTRSTSVRPVYERMLTDLQAGMAQVLVCYSTSRLTRRPLDYERLIRLTSDTGVQIATVVSGAVDLSTADGRLIARVMAAMDAAEAERTGERISRACQQQAEKGEWHGGPLPPFGYRFVPAGDKRSLAVLPERAALVREAAERVLAGQSLYRIRQDWNARGLTTSVGKPWRSQGIKRSLTRGAVAGLTERNGELFAGSWPAILDEPTWRAVRTVLLDPTRDTRTFVQRSSLHPLTGLLWCGLCRHLLRSAICGHVLTYWCAELLGGCAHIRIKAADVERFLLEEINARVAAEASGEQDGVPEHVAERADPVLAALRVQQHQLQDDHYDHLLPREDFLRQARRLAGRAADRRRELTGGWDRARTEQLVLTATLDDPEATRRAALRLHLVRVLVDPHPRGTSTAAHLGWTVRRLVVAGRLRPVWQGDQPTDDPVGDPLAMPADNRSSAPPPLAAPSTPEPAPAATRATTVTGSDDVAWAAPT